MKNAVDAYQGYKAKDATLRFEDLSA